jgi:hypothetical protein
MMPEVLGLYKMFTDPVLKVIAHDYRAELTRDPSFGIDMENPERPDMHGVLKTHDGRMVASFRDKGEDDRIIKVRCLDYGLWQNFCGSVMEYCGEIGYESIRGIVIGLLCDIEMLRAHVSPGEALLAFPDESVCTAYFDDSDISDWLSRAFPDAVILHYKERS